MRVIDLHCDTIYRCFTENKELYSNDFHISLERTNNLDEFIECCAIWMPDEYRGEEAVGFFQKYLSCYLQETNKNKDVLSKILSASDLDQQGHKLCSILTVEGGSAIGGELTNITFLYECGVRIMTLTWNADNEIGSGVLGSGRGLTNFGKEAVKKMEETGIIVDVSHLNDQGFWDVAEITDKPFIATHSNLRSICNHKRNLTNEQFNIIKSKGGIVGLNFARIFLDAEGNATLDSIYKMIDAFLSLGGEKTLALGTDFDGTDLPDHISGVESLWNLKEYLLTKNYNEGLLDGLFYKNAHNFLKNNLPRR